MTTIVITGAAGFIGSNFVRLALRRGFERVVAFDKLTYAGHLESLAAVSEDPRFVFVRGDIADTGQVAALYRDHAPSCLVNFAAESHVDRSIDDPDAFIRTNIVGTHRLLEGAREYLAGLDGDDASGFRLLHVSTDEVYGSLGSEGAFTEETPYAPNSPYAASKAAADHLVRAYCETFALPALITNCSNNYGPFQFPEKLIPLVVLNAAEGRDLPIYGDGANVRDWLHVEDHCDGLMLALEKGEPGRKYNLGGHGERSNLELIDAICAALDELRPARENPAMKLRGYANYSELKTFVPDRPGHDRRYAIDASRAEKELGWRPAHDLATGIRETVRWYLDHAEWCRAVQPAGDERSRRGHSPGH